jgi:hypothetical protein
VGSHRMKPYGECMYNAFHIILKYCLDGQTMVVNDRNMQLFLSER